MDLVLSAPDQATMLAGFQALGAMADGAPITQGVTPDGQDWFIVLQGAVMVPDGTFVQDRFGNPQPVVAQETSKSFWAVIRWLGADPPAVPAGITSYTPAADPATGTVTYNPALDPAIAAALVHIAGA